MKMKRILALISAALLVVSLTACAKNTADSGSAASSETTVVTDQTIIYGQVTQIDGSSVTIAVGTLDMPTGQPQSGSGSDSSGGAPDVGTSATVNATAGQSGSGAAPTGAPNSQPTDGLQPPSGQAPNMGQETFGNGGQPGGFPGFSATGETKTLTLSSGTVVWIDSMGSVTSGSISDIAVGDIIKVTMTGSDLAAVTVMTIGTGTNGGAPGGMSGGSETGSTALSGSYTIDGKAETSDKQTYASETSGQSAVLVSNGGSLTLTDAALTKSGDTSDGDQSNFYGLNAILAVTGGSSAKVSGTKLTSSAEGANGIFSTGSGSAVTADNVTISTTGNSSRGLDATYGGTINATNMTIKTTGAHCAPVATDRGGGTITVDGGTLSAAGDGSPCIYSTGSITVSNVTGKATGSQLAVVEGKNSITLDNCILTGAGLNGIMLYQSTSGDAAEGTARFTATASTLKTTSTGPMFYVTNTDAEALLQNTVLDFTGGILADIAGNSTNNWGTPGSNGGHFKLTGVHQVFKGDITCDDISKFALYLTENSALTGAIDTAHTASQTTVSLDQSSTWTVTGTSYISVLENAVADCSNIQSNGFTVYYDAANASNAWLNGATIALPGGGSLTPAV